ncbi:MAG: hypothetical protein L0Y58_15510, partial [Verrucomicrobia subdivision 3 bacterium]|nr:hypothetical protein [Limisphaerales bacterium]
MRVLWATILVILLATFSAPMRLLGAPPTIIQQPVSLIITQGNTAMFSVVADGDAPLHYNWRLNAASIPGGTNDVYIVTNAQVSQAGFYDVVITNLSGSVTSALAFLTVRGDPGTIRNPVGAKAAVGEGIEFDVEPSGTPPFTYQWLFNGAAIAGATNQVLTLTNLSLQQSGSYAAIVSNARGSATSGSANLAVSTNPPRRLTVFAPEINATNASQVSLGIELAANGQENSVAFSLKYDPAILQNPGFEVSFVNASANVDTSRTGEGLVGVSVTLPPGTRYPRSTILLGQLLFDLS